MSLVRFVLGLLLGAVAFLAPGGVGFAAEYQSYKLN